MSSLQEELASIVELTATVALANPSQHTEALLVSVADIYSQVSGREHAAASHIDEVQHRVNLPASAG